MGFTKFADINHQTYLISWIDLYFFSTKIMFMFMSLYLRVFLELLRIWWRGIVGAHDDSVGFFNNSENWDGFEGIFIRFEKILLDSRKLWMGRKRTCSRWGGRCLTLTWFPSAAFYDDNPINVFLVMMLKKVIAIMMMLVVVVKTI